MHKLELLARQSCGKLNLLLQTCNLTYTVLWDAATLLQLSVLNEYQTIYLLLVAALHTVTTSRSSLNGDAEHGTPLSGTGISLTCFARDCYTCCCGVTVALSF